MHSIIKSSTAMVLNFGLHQNIDIPNLSSVGCSVQTKSESEEFVYTGANKNLKAFQNVKKVIAKAFGVYCCHGLVRFSSSLVLPVLAIFSPNNQTGYWLKQVVWSVLVPKLLNWL